MPASKTQQKAVNKYMKANYDEIKVQFPKGKKRLYRNMQPHIASVQTPLLTGLLPKLWKTENKKYLGVLKTSRRFCFYVFVVGWLR